MINTILWSLFGGGFILLIIFIFTLPHSGEPDIIPRYTDDFHRAHEAYQQAQQNFDLAEPQYIDVAISDLGATENRVNNEVIKRRIEGGVKHGRSEKKEVGRNETAKQKEAAEAIREL